MAMSKRQTNKNSTASLGGTLASLRARSNLTQAEVARRMGTTQTAIARLEAGGQSPSIRTLQDFARSVGFCIEIGFVPAHDDKTGCILVVHGHLP